MTLPMTKSLLMTRLIMEDFQVILIQCIHTVLTDIAEIATDHTAY